MKNPLTEFRESCGLTRRELAVYLGFDYSLIYQVEHDYLAPTGPLLLRLAGVGVNGDEFMAKWHRYIAAKRGKIEDRVNGARATT